MNRNVTWSEKLLTLTVISAIALSGVGYSNPAHAFLDGVFGCDYSERCPCDQLIGDKSLQHADSGIKAREDQYFQDINHSRAYCESLKVDDHTCTTLWPLATAYTTVAALCWTGCAGVPWAITACSIGSISVSLMDFVAGVGIGGLTEDYAHNAARKLSFDANSAIGPATLMVNTAFSVTALVAASKAAAKESAAGTGRAGANMSCGSAIINTALAGYKWYDFKLIKDHSKSTRSDLDSVVSDSVRSACINAPTGSGKKGAFKPATAPGRTGDGSTGTQSGAVAGDIRGDSGELSVKDKVNKAAKDGKLADSFATAGFRQGLKDPKEDFNKMMNELAKNTGATPGDLAQSVQTVGLADTLAKFAGGNPEILKAIRDIDAKTKTGMGSSLAFESTGGGGSRGTASGGGGNPFGGFGKPAEPKGGVSDVKFGGFANDIWHAGSSKTIFEIVSDKTTQVSGRVSQ